ncbi:hypothetical protein CCR94_17210 [Rhodoblastus sphagnicola]|uniref:DUF4268 domain-containing protein n=1 Tax=Rhodoblastus sphagnicola TaxID=333368 RepID=A0A2S6N214_9HYPH|nr:hypothetical protein [Rhodoblastus sphagnicola]MBB4199721.1 hypothetical protein [Rhodoblastus sphagnicola]PPQ28661.1 hypothetical protein CCR94_17210 [Rhodoblastus sphagnicola]
MTDVLTLGRLETVSVRSAWAHEALAFTPWLAQNLDRLSEAIGIPLEHVQSEAPVSTFAADILARNPADGSMVLIENQLEGSDHGHLGQIMTYLAGLEAQTIVWIAPSFRDAHRSAIRWLNQHTVDPFAFFAVEVRVVRIGDSAMAPLFDVVEVPNQWERQVQRQARESAVASPRSEFRRAFWTHFLERHPEETAFGAVKAEPSRWKPATSDLFVVEYLAQDEVGVFVRGVWGVSPEARAVQLEPFAQRLQDGLGAPFAKGAFTKVLPIASREPANWDRMADWLRTESDRYVEVVKQVMEGTN